MKEGSDKAQILTPSQLFNGKNPPFLNVLTLPIKGIYLEELRKELQFSPLKIPNAKHPFQQGPTKAPPASLPHIDEASLWLRNLVRSGGASKLLPNFKGFENLYLEFYPENTFQKPEEDFKTIAEVSLSQVLINSVCKTAFNSGRASTLPQFMQEAYRRFVTTLPLTVIFKIQKEIRDSGADPLTAILICTAPSAAMRSFQEIVLEIKKRKIPLTKELLTDCVKAILPKYLLPEFIANSSMLVIRESDNFFDALTSAFLASLINGPLNSYKDDCTKKYVETKALAPELTKPREPARQPNIFNSFKNIGLGRIGGNIASACITAVVFCGVSSKFLTDIFKTEHPKPKDKDSQDHYEVMLRRHFKDMEPRRVSLLASPHHNIGLVSNATKNLSQENQPSPQQHQDIINRLKLLQECIAAENDRDSADYASARAEQRSSLEARSKEVPPSASIRGVSSTKVLQENSRADCFTRYS